MNESETIESALLVLEGDLKDATVELFGDYELVVEHVETRAENRPTPLGDTSVVAIIGYASDQMRGALALMATPATILGWQRDSSPNEPGVADDTIAEFSNMLLGRLKHKLFRRGVTLMVTTPTTACGANMTLRPPAGVVSRWQRFEGPTGAFAVRLDATFTPGFSFARRSSTFAPAAAGDMMLF
jgi:CheY-specific phosphatase CheX